MNIDPIVRIRQVLIEYVHSTFFLCFLIFFANFLNLNM